METVVIDTAGASFTLKVGENSRAFLWLFNLTQSELAKCEMDAEITASRLVKYSGSAPQLARYFVSSVVDITQGREPPDEWGIWAGQYARKFAAQKCKRDIKFYSLLLMSGLIGSGHIVLYDSGSEMDVVQILLLLCSLLTVFGFYKVVLLAIDLLQFRGGAWPEPNGKSNT